MKFSPINLLTGLALSSCLVLAACSTTPERVAELEQAQSAVQRLESEAMAEKVAAEKLARAREALARAESALENNESLEWVRHEAYLARRHAEIGLELTSEAEALEQVRQAENRRNELRLKARSVEAERAQMLAQQRAAQAEESAREARLSQSVAEAALDEADRLTEELEEMEAEKTERGVVLTLGDVLFDTGRAELKAGAMSAVDRLAGFLEENPDRRLMIEGHTDARGAEEYNRTLSAERALAVADALTERGITRDRLRTVGLGEAYPVATNETESGMQQNRRVEVVISDASGEFPRAAEQRLTSR